MVSHIASGMADASSKMAKARRPLLCKPAIASVLFSDQVMASTRQVFSWPGNVEESAVAEYANQLRLMQSPYHLASSGQVLVRSCPSVLAVTMPRVSRAVDSAHRTSQATSADLPTPCPD